MALIVGRARHHAAKYGALAVPTGEIAVTWTIMAPTDNPHLAFRWNEIGVKLSMPAYRRGFGIELIEQSIAYELGAKIDLRFAADGLKCSIVIPFTERMVLNAPGAAQRAE